MTSTNLSDRYSTRVLPVTRIVDALCGQGAIALPLLRNAWRERLLAESRLYRYRPARKDVGRDDARVRQRMDVEPNLRADSLFHTLCKDFQQLFDMSTAGCGNFSEPVTFNDLMLQRYTVGEVGITPHRDRTSYRNIVVLFVLSGRGRFCVAPERTEQGAIEIPNGPGDIILMRAPGFVDELGNDMPRPYHFVHNITEPRYVFGLRDDAEKR